LEHTVVGGIIYVEKTASTVEIKHIQLVRNLFDAPQVTPANLGAVLDHTPSNTCLRIQANRDRVEPCPLRCSKSVDVVAVVGELVRAIEPTCSTKT